MLDEEITQNITLLGSDEQINSSMKKTLEENNKEREIFSDDDGKYPSTKLYQNNIERTAHRASQLKKRHHDLIQKYGNPEKLHNTKYELDFIKSLHSAALTIQNVWRDFILTRKAPADYIDLHFENKEPVSNNDRSTSRNACSIPKLDLSQVGSKKDLEAQNIDGLFNQEPMLDLSTKRIQSLMQTADLSSML